MDNKYFESVYEQTNNNFIYTSYKPKYSGMVLFSESGSPLVGLQVNCPNNDAKSILTRRPEKVNSLCDFQLIATEDNKEFELIISNFTDNKVSFNISHYDVLTKSPAFQQLNEINILKKHQSVSVKSDYTKDNAALILSAIKETINNNTTNVSVEKAEQSIKNYDASYISIQVYPEQISKEFSSQFVNAKWSDVDIIVMIEEKKQIIPRIRYEERGSDTRGGIGGLFGDSEENITTNNGEFHYETVIRVSESCEKNMFMPQSSNVQESTGLFGSMKDKFMGLFKKNSDDNNNKTTMNNVINQSSIGKITGGRKIQVTSTVSDTECDYEAGTSICVIGLSISNKLKFNNHTVEMFVNQAKELIDGMINNENKLLLNKINNIYKSDECCICFSEAPDTVMYPCGHQCIHYVCGTNELERKCPLCRSIINAFVQVN
jgi:hypothetical protein